VRAVAKRGVDGLQSGATLHLRPGPLLLLREISLEKRASSEINSEFGGPRTPASRELGKRLFGLFNWFKVKHP
jgi:hypothetical protein